VAIGLTAERFEPPAARRCYGVFRRDAPAGFISFDGAFPPIGGPALAGLGRLFSNTTRAKPCDPESTYAELSEHFALEEAVA